MTDSDGCTKFEKWAPGNELPSRDLLNGCASTFRVLTLAHRALTDDQFRLCIQNVVDSALNTEAALPYGTVIREALADHAIQLEPPEVRTDAYSAWCVYVLMMEFSEQGVQGEWIEKISFWLDDLYVGAPKSVGVLAAQIVGDHFFGRP